MLDPDNIKGLVDEVLAVMNPKDVYEMALQNLNLKALKEEKNITRTELNIIMATGGFVAVIRFALENLELSDDETGDKDDGRS